MKKKLFSEIPYLKSARLILRKLEDKDAEALQAFSHDPEVYRYLPTFLFEQKYDDAGKVISRLYDECFEESIILGIFVHDDKAEEFAGLAELYGYKDKLHKISVGYRLRKELWGRGIASETLGLMVNYLYDETDIEIITASTMIENRASARVLEKNGFELVVRAAEEDWGFDKPTLADKWIR